MFLICFIDDVIWMMYGRHDTVHDTVHDSNQVSNQVSNQEDEPSALELTSYDTYEDETPVPPIDKVPDEELFEEDVYYVEKTDEPNKIKRLTYKKTND